jgi:hypothetical protein
MLTAEELQDARDDMHAELVDVVDISHVDGTTFDPVTLQQTPNVTVRATDVPALVIPDPQHTGRQVESGEPVMLRTYSVTVPVETPVKVEDRIDVTASYDAEAVGVQLVVKDVRVNSLGISRRLRCQVRQTDDPEL